MILLFIGTALVHMVLETQNRYHYNILPIFAILASIGIMDIFEHYNKVPTRISMGKPVFVEQPAIEKLAEGATISSKTTDNKFDMLRAIKEGHVIVTVSEAYQRNGKQENVQEKKIDKQDTKTINDAHREK